MLVQNQALKYTDRYHKIIRQTSVTTPVHALVEFITNSIDAYNSVDPEKTIKWKIDIEVQRDPQNSWITIRDQAKGMTSLEMQNKLLTVGEYTAESTSRGLFGRGAKDASFLGNTYFHAIKDDKYSAVSIHKDNTGYLIHTDIDVTSEIRQELGIGKNGMLVKLELSFGILPKLKDLFIRTRKNIFLRDIVTAKHIDIHFKGTQIITDSWINQENSCSQETFEKYFWYEYPLAKKVISYDYEVNGYPGVKAKFELYQSETQIKNPRVEDELEYGITVSSDTSVYEVGALYYQDPTVTNYRWNPNLKYLYGRLTCPSIDTLAREAGENRLNDKNPYILIDPNRRDGLSKTHPFVKALYEIPYRTLEVAINSVQDIRDSNLITGGDVDEIMSELSSFLSDNIISDDMLFTWRSKTDHENLTKVARAIQNVEIDPEFLGLSKKELESFKFKAKKEYVPRRKHKPRVVVKFADDDTMEDPYEIQYFPHKIVIKLNFNYPDIKPFCSLVDGNLEFQKPGKAMIAINGHLSNVLSKILLRQEILHTQAEINLTTDQLQELYNRELQVRKTINNGLTQRTMGAITKIKTRRLINK